MYLSTSIEGRRTSMDLSWSTTARRLSGAVGVAALGWTAYSATSIPHDVPFPRPVPGDAGHVDTLDAGRVATYQLGPGDGDPVLLVHGVHAAASAYDVRPLYTALAMQGWHAVAVDLPGYGHSERSNRTYDPALMTNAVVSVLEKVIQRPAHVIALSLGAEFAAAAALRRPDLVRSLALISPTGMGEYSPRSESGWLGGVLRTPVVGQSLFDLISSRPSIEYFLAKSFVGDVDEGYRAFAWVSSHQHGARFAPAAFLSGALFDPHVFDHIYRRVPQPALVIHDRDPYSSFARLPELVSMPNWSAERLTPTNGLPHFEMLDRTTETLQRFWRSP